MNKDNNYYQVNEQLEEFFVLNLTDCGRFWKRNFALDEELMLSLPFINWLEANKFIQEQVQADRDIQIKGYYINPVTAGEGLIQVVYSERESQKALLSIIGG